METAIDLQLLVAFSSVADHASFSRAAEALGVGKGTVSRSIARLEALLGVELLHRTTHRVSLSTAGMALHERTKQHLTSLRAAVLDLPERDAVPSGLLRITAAPDFGGIVLPTMLAAFSRRFPEVRFDVRLTSAQVDLVKDGYDLAIRMATGPLRDSSLTVRRLGRSTAAFYAAPSYVARRGRPRDVADPRHAWVLHPGVLRVLGIKREAAGFLIDDFFLARDLLRDGVGIGVLPRFVAKSYVSEGLLEELDLVDQKLMAGELVMLYPSSGTVSKKVAAFRDFLASALRSDREFGH